MSELDNKHDKAVALRRRWYWRQYAILCACGFQTRWCRKLSGAGRRLYYHWVGVI